MLSPIRPSNPAQPIVAPDGTLQVAPSRRLQVAPSRRYGNETLEQLSLFPEYLDAAFEQKNVINLSTYARGVNELRKESPSEKGHTGIRLTEQGVAIDTIANPDSPDGRWDPLQYMPRFVFDRHEDAFPVAPGFDGDAIFENDAPSKANGTDGHYKDGQIGGNQGLSTGFSVSRKGEFTVLTYSFYYAHNKAGDYHANDYSTAQVYLKPGADGKLAPAYLYTSWHYGGALTAWKDLVKDAQGKPVIEVELGSHALQPVSGRESLPKKGLQLRGDGKAELNGQVLPYKVSVDAFQSNVKADRLLKPGTPKGDLRLEAMKWGQAGIDPLLPSDFEHPWSDLLKKGKSIAKKALASVEGFVERGVSAVKAKFKSWFN